MSDPTPDLRVLTPGLSAEEIAAVTAVLRGALDELAASAETEAPRVSAWQKSQRGLRRPLSPGAGAWRSFSG